MKGYKEVNFDDLEEGDEFNLVEDFGIDVSDCDNLNPPEFYARTKTGSGVRFADAEDGYPSSLGTTEFWRGEKVFVKIQI